MSSLNSNDIYIASVELFGSDVVESGIAQADDDNVAGAAPLVDAIDIADTGLSLFSGKHPNIHPICADFDNFDIPANHYDLIVNVKFLNRRLFPYIKAGLTPGGVLIFQTLLDVLNSDQNPSAHADYYLRQNELLHAFLALKILFYSEAEDETGGDAAWLASLVASKTC